MMNINSENTRPNRGNEKEAAKEIKIEATAKNLGL
jgi:hypothetical protein